MRSCCQEQRRQATRQFARSCQDRLSLELVEWNEDASSAHLDLDLDQGQSFRRRSSIPIRHFLFRQTLYWIGETDSSSHSSNYGFGLGFRFEGAIQDSYACAYTYSDASSCNAFN